MYKRQRPGIPEIRRLRENETLEEDDEPPWGYQAPGDHYPHPGFPTTSERGSRRP
ncbi:MAG: hypothetical protein KUG77_24445 [Nannocystaceae bacterium]|nr:hypothetical protein [Nannocystaceae bacterium]